MNNKWRVIAKRELNGLTREKTLLLVIAIQIVIASFSSFLVVGLVSMYSTSSLNSDIGMTIGVIESPHSEPLEETINSNLNTEMRVYQSQSAALDAYSNGQVDAVFSVVYTNNNRYYTTAIIPKSGIKSTLVKVRVTDILKKFSEKIREQRSEYLDYKMLEIKNHGQSLPFFSFTYAVLIPILVFLPSFISGSILSDSLIEDNVHGVSELMHSTGANLSDIVFGKAIVYWAIIPIQVFAWISIIQLRGTRIANEIELLVVSGLIGAFAVGIGILTGISFHERSKSQVAYSIALLLLISSTLLLPAPISNVISRLAIDGYYTTPFIEIGSYLVGTILFIGIVRSIVQRSNSQLQ